MNIETFKIKWLLEGDYHKAIIFDWNFNVYPSYDSIKSKTMYTWSQSAPGLCMDIELMKYETIEEAKQACENKIYKLIEDFLNNHSKE
jgi:hypothetical protein